MKINILAAALLTILTASTQAAEKPLRILLVNDDGCQSVGTTSLQEKLAAKGYDVWMVAPDTNQSGIGSAITFKPGKTFDVKKVADKRYCFPGTPADAVDFGLWGLMKEAAPDLVISGVNDGPNTGMAQVNSGTVSAAARALRYGFPAIAASIGYRFTEQEMKNKWPSTNKYWPDSVDYVVTVVDKLNATREPGTALLPKGSGLSINYPPLPATEIKGVHYIDNEQFPVPQISYELQADGTAKQGMNPASLTPTTADTDSGWLNKGYITYTLFDGSWNAPQFQAQYEKRLGR
ncbi:TPA: 5'/3'-nucleotidase SurE [Raoultella planticola]|uniref:5'/3'-nucleotidase SurE n=1 Tax=Raoultella planticola TaxID=575 RepID=UPI000BFE8209|nr:5'/3'-nucleotidase SurE [Raoultella planticola]ATM07390.1 5'/3'-nucleotidase SurE [Raoultella planticola]ATM15398.1 5'/3'-nucleotidase SurE [Raoultella planticola]ELU0691690.1 5'/3'-nucleotidase SurE [Raoultella planticola]PHH24659.1 5'/3'-nucleotidase SurE [Raoultella planticola]TDV02412.1 5'-nucleotidase /3'-nucleotidase /exopolyphosphatase [Raoultella planticola]